MRVLLQHQSTQLYLTNDDKWSADNWQAKDFGTSLKAMDFLQRFKVRSTNIVLKFDDPKYDIVLRIMAQQNQTGDFGRV